MTSLPTTLAALQAAGTYPYRTVKAELRANLITALRAGTTAEELFPGLIGYEETVIPQVINAVLAGHDLLLLGLRGQAKTRLARALGKFLDEVTPYLAGDPLRSHPLHPVGPIATDLVARGGAAAVAWLTRAERYGEKLATPDVAVADLIGDLDPIRAHREGLDLGDLRAVTFGIIPRTNRGIFCINELPDLAPRIQVALFNLLEESDVQVRGIPLRLSMDLMMVFTANPEDYTARGQIITPLKDRIGSQILTHYPRTRADGVRILQQEADLPTDVACQPDVDPLFDELIEQAARCARASEYVDASSGVSARLTISARELLHANVLARGLRTGETRPRARLVDLAATLAAMTGKIELAYEGEQEGPLKVGRQVLGEAVRALWAERLPPVMKDEEDERDQGPWKAILRWFAAGNRVTLDDRSSDLVHQAALSAVPDLAHQATTLLKLGESASTIWQEFILEGLFHGGAIARDDSLHGPVYSDLLAHMLTRKTPKRRREGSG